MAETRGASDLDIDVAPLGDRTALEEAVVSARPAVLLAAGFSGAINLLMLVSPLYMMQVYDRVLGSGSHATLLWLTVLVAFAFAVMACLEVARSRVMGRIGLWLERSVAEPVISAVMERRARGVAGGGQALRDLSGLRSFLSGGAPNVIFDLPFTPLFLLALFALHPTLGLIGVISVIVLFGVAYGNERFSRDLLRRAERHNHASQSYIDSTSRNADAVRSMGLFPGVIARWRSVSDLALGSARKAADFASLVTSVTRALRLFVQSLILGVGAYLAIEGAVSPGAIIAASILLGRALAPIDQSISVWKGVLSARRSYERLNDVLRAAPPPAETQPLPDPVGHVKVEDVTYYASGAPGADEVPILRNVSFEATPGEILGVVGPSGAGKTTLCQILVGAVRPTSGSVRIDNADLRFWNPHELGRHLGYLPQAVELLRGTVRDNISRMTDGGPIAVLEAARLADVHDLVLRLPDGYDTAVGDGGAMLSAGQRQRVGLARALFGGPKVLVLDEPNSNLDQTGESALIAALDHMKARGAAVIVVAHRPSVLARADKLLALRDGQVVIHGPRAEILSELYGPRPVQTITNQGRARLGRDESVAPPPEEEPPHESPPQDPRPHDPRPHDPRPHDARPHDARPHDARPQEPAPRDESSPRQNRSARVRKAAQVAGDEPRDQSLPDERPPARRRGAEPEIVSDHHDEAPRQRSRTKTRGGGRGPRRGSRTKPIDAVED